MKFLKSYKDDVDVDDDVNKENEYTIESKGLQPVMYIVQCTKNS